VANGRATLTQNILTTETTNFQLGIPFAADSSHMEGLSRTGSDVNWTTNGTAILHPLVGTLVVGYGNINGTAMTNILPPVCCYFSAVCDWNLIMRSNDYAVPQQCYSTQTPLNM
jgi:hypothetical protein